MEKFFIKNKNNKKISVMLYRSKDQRGLAFVMPGLGAKKEDIHIQAFIKSFIDKKFTVVTFDVTNGTGESDGDYSQASFTGYYNDLCDLISWAKNQKWYSEPFILAGHSMGGGCILWYAYNHPNEVSAIAPISTVIGGHQTLAKFGRDDLVGFKTNNEGKEEIIKLDWGNFKNDILNYDIVPIAGNLSMPVLMIVGSDDLGTPLEDQMKLYENLGSRKEIHVIEGAPHTFVADNHLEEIQDIFKNWIDKKILK